MDYKTNMAGLMVTPGDNAPVFGLGTDHEQDSDWEGMLIVPMDDGDSIEVKITDCRDNLVVSKLIEDAKAGDKNARRYLASIIGKYDWLASARLLILDGEEGEAWNLVGDIFHGRGEYVDARKAYKDAAQNNNPCGKCKLGRYYAEGKGCRKNKILAKKWISEASDDCESASKYLDLYGLR